MYGYLGCLMQFGDFRNFCFDLRMLGKNWEKTGWKCWKKLEKKEFLKQLFTKKNRIRDGLWTTISVGKIISVGNNW